MRIQNLALRYKVYRNCRFQTGLTAEIGDFVDVTHKWWFWWCLQWWMGDLVDLNKASFLYQFMIFSVGIYSISYLVAKFRSYKAINNFEWGKSNLLHTSSKISWFYTTETMGCTLGYMWGLSLSNIGKIKHEPCKLGCSCKYSQYWNHCITCQIND